MKLRTVQENDEIRKSTLSRIQILKHTEQPERGKADRKDKRDSSSAMAGLPDYYSHYHRALQTADEPSQNWPPSINIGTVSMRETSKGGPLRSRRLGRPSQPPRRQIHQDSRLLDLPTELRLRVLDHLLDRIAQLPICLLISTKWTWLWGRGMPPDITSLSLVCKQLNAEIQDTIWDRLTFKIRPSVAYGLPSTCKLGCTETLAMLRRMRRIELCVPLASPREEAGLHLGIGVGVRLRICAEVVGKCQGLREVVFNCDTNAYRGEHDDADVKAVAKAFAEVLVRKQREGVRVRLTNREVRRNSWVVVQVFKDAGLVV